MKKLALFTAAVFAAVGAAKAASVETMSAELEKAAKRFAALAKVEERHANQYRAQLAKVTA